MNAFFRIACASCLLLASSAVFAATIKLDTSATNVVATWHDIAADTVNGKGSATVTASELRPLIQTDMTTVALAMYDAASAIDGRYQPYAVTPHAPAAGASLDAAVSAAAYGVLRGLFPNRAALYQGAYDKAVDALPAGPARDKGLALGAEVAAAMLARRANDGRSVEVPAYTPATEAGKYQGPSAMMAYVPSIRPFSLARIGQFRPGPPPALTSAAYAASFNETKTMGGSASTTRSAAQSEGALFQTEAPWYALTRNFGRFARSTTDAAEAARLLAAIYVVNADAMLACFDAKYFYNSWRPNSAIVHADLDGNAATVADPAWASSQLTPNHPEYPAAHSCTAGGMAAMLRLYYGSGEVAFFFDSQASGSIHHYESVEAMQRDGSEARINGGMHFRYSTVAGEKLGAEVAEWVMQRHFGKRK
jgi:hypothetical protein